MNADTGQVVADLPIGAGVDPDGVFADRRNGTGSYRIETDAQAWHIYDRGRLTPKIVQVSAGTDSGFL